MNPTLSIIIPFYNTEPEFYEKAFSCLKTIPDDIAEILVIDDGSDEDAFERLNEYLSRNAPDALVFRKENGGQNSARQLGVDRAEGKYVLFLDSDDCIDPDCLLELAAYLEGHNPDVVAFNHDVVTPEGEVLRSYVPWPAGFNHACLQRLSLNSDSLCRQCYCLKRLKELPFGLVQGIRIGEDLSSALSFNLALKEHVSYGGTLYHYVKRASSIVNKPPISTLDDILIAFDEVDRRCGPGYSGCASEVEWMAVVHVLLWNGVRIVGAVGPDRNRKRAMFEWMNQRFPDWRKNHYFKTEPIANEFRFKLLVSGQWGVYSLLRRAKGLMRQCGVFE